MCAALNIFEDHVLAVSRRLQLEFDRALEDVAEDLLGVADQEVHLPRNHHPLHDATHKDHVCPPLDEDLRNKHAVPRASHELANEHVFHQRLGASQATLQVTCVPRIPGLAVGNLVRWIGHLIGEWLAVVARHFVTAGSVLLQGSCCVQGRATTGQGAHLPQALGCEVVC